MRLKKLRVISEVAQFHARILVRRSEGAFAVGGNPDCIENRAR
jgi:hypothetical protein